MAESKKDGIEIKGPKILHGKRAMFTRNEKEVVGILLSKTHQVSSSEFIFKFKDENGATCVSPVTKEEMKFIEDYLLDY
jgi:hypothetical protein